MNDVSNDERRSQFYKSLKPAYDDKQVKSIVNRCQKLEDYCRELIRVNKILDCENRLAIAQIINLTDLNQLNNLE